MYSAALRTWKSTPSGQARVYRTTLGDGHCGFRAAGVQLFELTLATSHRINPEQLRALRFMVHHILVNRIDEVVGAVAWMGTPETRQREKAAILEHAQNLVEVDTPGGPPREIQCDRWCDTLQWFGGELK